LCKDAPRICIFDMVEKIEDALVSLCSRVAKYDSPHMDKEKFERRAKDKEKYPTRVNWKSRHKDNDI